jgi:hypothetical protein
MAQAVVMARTKAAIGFKAFMTGLLVQREIARRKPRHPLVLPRDSRAESDKIEKVTNPARAGTNRDF